MKIILFSLIHFFFRDDLEQLAYTLIDIAAGLPWSSNKLKDLEEWKRAKDETPVDVLCKGLPEVYENFLSYSRGLAFSDKPNYYQWINAFKLLNK